MGQRELKRWRKAKGGSQRFEMKEEKPFAKGLRKWVRGKRRAEE